MALSGPPAWKRLPAPPTPAPPAPEPAIPEGWAAARWLLLEDERGTAMVEMVVLIPVYVLLLMGLFAFGEMSLSHQALAQAGRFQLWTGGASNYTDQDIQKAFFGPYHGEYASADWSETPWKLRPDNPEGKRAVELAWHVLNNDTKPEGLPAGDGYPTNDDAKATYGSGESALKRWAMSATWKHQGITFGLVEPVFSWEGQVLVWNPGHSRGEFVDGKQHHWVAHPILRPPFEPAAWGGSGGRKRYLNPTRTTGPKPSSTSDLNVKNNQGNGTDPGVWDVNARIGGSITAEHNFYAPKMPN